MRADLDRLFSALGAHADTVPPPAPERARRRGDQRRRSRVAIICATLVLLVGAGAAVARADFGQRRNPPAAPTPHPTVAFTTLSPVGTSIPMALGRSGVGVASVSDDRVYVAGLDARQHLLLGASYLSSGRPVWPIIDSGQSAQWPGLYVRANTLVVVAGQQGGSVQPIVVLVFDPATGTKRWQATFADFNLAAFDSVLVTRSAADHAVLGLDWSTGTPRWRIPLAPGELPTIAQHLTTGEVDGLGQGLWPDTADQRLYLIGADGTVRAYNGNTGQPLGTWANAAPATVAGDTPRYVIYDNLLYAVSRDTDVRVSDLTRTTTSSSLVYTSPSGSRVHSMTPCGVGRVCLIVQDNGAADLVAVDRATQSVLWRRPAPQAEYAATVGDRILTDRGQLFDLDGQQLSNDAALDTFWLTPGSALVLAPADLTDIRSDVEVIGLSAVDGSGTPLGHIPPLRGSCSRTTDLLVCPAADGFHVWRFASG
jgi:hypothetical protein